MVNSCFNLPYPWNNFFHTFTFLSFRNSAMKKRRKAQLMFRNWWPQTWTVIIIRYFQHIFELQSWGNVNRNKIGSKMNTNVSIFHNLFAIFLPVWSLIFFLNERITSFFLVYTHLKKILSSFARKNIFGCRRESSESSEFEKPTLKGRYYENPKQ